jgi:hypothetical protein
MVLVNSISVIGFTAVLATEIICTTPTSSNLIECINIAPMVASTDYVILLRVSIPY